MFTPILIIILVAACFIVFVLFAVWHRHEKENQRKAQRRPAPQRPTLHTSITMRRPITPPLMQSAPVEEFSDRRHPTWAAAAAVSSPRPPPTRHSPSRNTARIPHRPARVSTPDPPTIRHPTWVAAAEHAAEEAAARRGRPPPFKLLDLSIPPPTYDKHSKDIRVTPAT